MRKLTNITIGLVACLLTGAAQQAVAQSRWQWELRGDFAATTNRVGSEDLGTGLGFEGTIAYHFLPKLGVYAGWGWHRFWSDTYDGYDRHGYYYRSNGADIDTEESGFVLGLQWQDRIAGWDDFSYRIRGGLTYSDAKLQDERAGTIDEDNGVRGWEVGIAIIVPLAGDWRLTQGIRYRAVLRDAILSGRAARADIEYVTFNVGFSRSF